MGKVVERLESNSKTRGKVTPVFISLDCKRDSLEQIKNYSKDFHPNIQFLTGSPGEPMQKPGIYPAPSIHAEQMVTGACLLGQVEAAARAYRVYFSDTNELADDDMDYLIDHSIVMYVCPGVLLLRCRKS